MDLMLATPSRTLNPDSAQLLRDLTATGRWGFEVKWDGIRALIDVDCGHVRIQGRRGHDITYRYPEIEAALAAHYPRRQVLLDGEIIVIRNGRPDFAAAHRRDAQTLPHKALALSRSLPARFAPFDLLVKGGVDQYDRPYTDRRALLARELERLGDLDAVMPTQFGLDGPEMWTVVQTFALEGLVAKRLNSTYQPRRSRDWVKIRANRRLSAIVTGFDPGEGDRASTFGALHMALLDAEHRLVPVGRVGSGFSSRDLRTIRDRLDAGVHPIILDVEYLEAPAGQLRFPVMKGVRTDVDILDCTLDQLL